MTWRLSVLGLGAYAAICMSPSPASAKDIYPPPPSFTLDAKDINLRCSSYVGGDGPWTGALNYRINLNDSTVNGENLQIDRIDGRGPRLSENLDRIDVKGPKLRWHGPVDASVPAAEYLLDLSKGRLDVTFEYDGRGSRRFRLQCINKLLKFAQGSQSAGAGLFRPLLASFDLIGDLKGL
jgi:hypothetical protein